MQGLKIFERDKEVTEKKKFPNPWIEVLSNKVEYRSHRKFFSDNEQSPHLHIYYSIKFAHYDLSTDKSKKKFCIE